MISDFDNKIINNIIYYWFNTLNSYKYWFGGSKEIDNHIKINYSKYVEKAQQGELNYWKNSLSGCLALILLLDQFARNIYRNSYRAFAFDDYALRLTNFILDKNLLSNYSSNKIMFILMPLMHSESIDDKDKLIDILNNLNNLNKNKEFTTMIQYTIKHKDVLEQFGRYPKRNLSYGRICTNKELEYLNNNKNSMF